MASNHLPTELTIVCLLGILSFLLVIYFTHRALFLYHRLFFTIVSYFGFVLVLSLLIRAIFPLL